MENNSPKQQSTQPVIDPDKLNDDDWFLGVRQQGPASCHTATYTAAVKHPKTGKMTRPQYIKRGKTKSNVYIDKENLQIWRGIRNKSQFVNLALKQAVGVMYWALQQYKDPETYKSRGADAPPEHFGGVKPEHIIQVFNETYPLSTSVEAMIARKKEIPGNGYTELLEPRQAVTWHETSNDDENDSTEPLNAQEPTEHNLDEDVITAPEPATPTTATPARLELI